MSKLKTHYIVVSDDAPDYVVREAVRLKAKQLSNDVTFNDIKVVRESELRQMTHKTNQQKGEGMNVQITKTVGEYTMEIRVENIPKDVNAVPSIIEELKKALSNDG